MVIKEKNRSALTDVHGGLYVVRESSISGKLLRPVRRLPFGGVRLSTDPGRGGDAPRLTFRVNADWSMTVDTQGSQRGLGIVSFPVLRATRGESLAFGDGSPLIDFTIKPTEADDMAVLLNTEKLLRTRVVFVAPKSA